MNNEQAGEVRKTGWRKISVAILLLVIIAVVGLLWLAMPPNEPSYNGKPLSCWLTNYETAYFNTNDPKTIESKEAIQRIGTNAIPALIRMVQAKDSTLKMDLMNLVERQNYVDFHFTRAEDRHSRAELGMHALGDLATNAVPSLIQICANSPSAGSHETADDVLMEIYPKGGTATPYWVQPEKREDWYINAGKVKLRWGDNTNAITAFSEAIKLNSTNYAACSYRGTTENELKDYVGALADFNREVELEPTNAYAYSDRGSVKIQLNDLKGAIDDFTRLIELDGSNQAAFRARGFCKFDLKDFKGASDDLTQAITLDTNDAQAYHYRGLARANLRKLDDAMTNLNKAAEISPEEATIYRSRAMVEALQKNYELALADASKSLQLDDKDANAYVTRGRIKNALKDYQGALLDFDKAIELNPKDPAAFVGRGTSRMLLDDFQNAATDLEKTLQLDPKNVVAFLIRGCIKMKRGDDDAGALADFERAVGLAPQAPETRTILGVFQYKISQWPSALENCRKAVELGPLGNVGELNSYIWLIRAQSGEQDAAGKELENYLNSLQDAKTNEWDASIARFFTGTLSESNFLREATTKAKRPSAVIGQVSESLYYAGMKRKIAGDKPGAADLFQKCLDIKDDNNFGYMNALVEMRAMKKQ